MSGVMPRGMMYSRVVNVRKEAKRAPGCMAMTFWYEELACGHEIMHTENPYGAKKRRCTSCEFEKGRKEST